MKNRVSTFAFLKFKLHRYKTESETLAKDATTLGKEANDQASSVPPPPAPPPSPPPAVTVVSGAAGPMRAAVTAATAALALFMMA